MSAQQEISQRNLRMRSREHVAGVTAFWDIHLSGRLQVSAPVRWPSVACPEPVGVLELEGVRRPNGHNAHQCTSQVAAGFLDLDRPVSPGLFLEGARAWPPNPRFVTI